MKHAHRSYLVILAAVLPLFILSSLARAMETHFEEDNTLPRVQFALVVRGGSVADPEGKEGLTQFLGELLLRGTKVRAREALNAAIDQLGADVGVETRHEALILRGSVLSRNLSSLLSIVREVVLSPALSAAEIKKLKKEVVSALMEETSQDAHVSLRSLPRNFPKIRRYQRSLVLQRPQRLAYRSSISPAALKPKSKSGRSACA